MDDPQQTDFRDPSIKDAGRAVADLKNQAPHRYDNHKPPRLAKAVADTVEDSPRGPKTGEVADDKPELAKAAKDYLQIVETVLRDAGAADPVAMRKHCKVQPAEIAANDPEAFARMMRQSALQRLPKKKRNRLFPRNRGTTKNSGGRAR